MAMNDNSKKVLQFLKENYGKEFTAAEIVTGCEDELINIRTVTGVVNGMVKASKSHPEPLAVRREETVTGADGKEAKIKWISLTEYGYSFDPIAVEQAELAAKEAEKEAKRAAKAAQ